MNQRSMNVIVIVSDTCRQDHLGCYGNEWMHTESLDRLASQSVIFDNCYAASLPTLPHRADCFLGKLSCPSFGWGPMPREGSTLAELLTQAGYTTQLIHDTPHLTAKGHYYERGFQGYHWVRGQEGDCPFTRANDVPPMDWPTSKDRYDEPLCYNHMLQRLDHPGELGHHSARTVNEACRWLETNHEAERFMLWVDLFDPHEPWDAPDWFTSLYYPGDFPPDRVRHPRYDYTDFLTAEELQWCHAAYCGELTLVDKWIGVLLRKIEDLGLFADTAVIFTSDHGFYLGEHGRIGKSGTADDPWPLYEEIIKEPLLIRLPDGPRGVRQNQLVQPLDLRPTILDLCEVPDDQRGHGKSLANILNGEDVRLREIAISGGCLLDRERSGVTVTVTHEDGWALVMGPTDAENELYYLPDDPRQMRNVIKDNEMTVLEIQAMFRMALTFLDVPPEVVKQW
ncbi:MAG: sulfatase [Armatimonadia bacterium]